MICDRCENQVALKGLKELEIKFETMVSDYLSITQ